MKKFTSAELVKEILSKVTGKEMQSDNMVTPKELYESLNKKDK